MSFRFPGFLDAFLCNTLCTGHCICKFVPQRITESGICMQGRCNQDPNSRSVNIMITDSCPQCEGDHLDIQVSTF